MRQSAQNTNMAFYLCFHGLDKVCNDAVRQGSLRLFTSSSSVSHSGGAAKGKVAGGPLKKLGLQNVDNIIAVSSAKGGVGKSTTAVNLAVALATSLNLKVGLLDADVHGPSIGKMMNLKGKPAVQSEGHMLMLPKENYRVATMSMSYFMESEDQPAAWRGPMANSAFDKMIFGTAWGHLNALIVDLPPGTGDSQINLAQRVPISGAVIVSTPQDIALMDAKRGTQLFRKLGVPILGMVENMSYHACSKCGHKDYIFGHEGVVTTAQQYGLKLLAQVPLHTSVRVQADAGAPIVINQPDHPCSMAYIELAKNVWQALQEAKLQQERQQPKISVG